MSEKKQGQPGLQSRHTYRKSITIPALKKSPYKKICVTCLRGVFSYGPMGAFYTGFRHAEVIPTLQMGKQRFNSKTQNCTLSPR